MEKFGAFLPEEIAARTEGPRTRPLQRVYRQFFITHLGHDEPTIPLTNDAGATAKNLITRYAKRMLIENALADAVRFFHIDALSSSVGFKVDLQPTPAAHAKGPLVWLNMDQKELDDAYNQSVYAPHPAEG